jgi:hypothetical protein
MGLACGARPGLRLSHTCYLFFTAFPAFLQGQAGRRYPVGHGQYLCKGNGDTLYLPSTDGAQEVYQNLSPAPVAVSYIAGYDRKTGELKLAYLAYVNPNESYAIRFQDFEVSENQDTLWVAVDLPNVGGCRSRPSSGAISVNDGTIIVQQWSSGFLSSVGWQTSFSYSLHSSASAGQVWQITRSD